MIPMQTILLEVFNMYYSEVDGRKNMAGGFYRIDMLPTTCHVYFNSVTGATPDGRLKGVPLRKAYRPCRERTGKARLR